MTKKFYVASVGDLFQISLEMFADKLTDQKGKEISADDMGINDTAYALFRSGTGTTRTSVTRIE